MLEALSVDTYPDGGPVNQADVFLGLKTDADGTVQSATMIRSVRPIATSHQLHQSIHSLVLRAFATYCSMLKLQIDQKS